MYERESYTQKPEAVPTITTAVSELVKLLEEARGLTGRVADRISGPVAEERWPDGAEGLGLYQRETLR